MVVYKKPTKKQRSPKQILWINTFIAILLAILVSLLYIMFMIFDIPRDIINPLFIIPYVWICSSLFTIILFQKNKENTANTFEWKDIVKINNEFHLVSCPVSFSSTVIPTDILYNQYLGNTVDEIDKTLDYLETVHRDPSIPRNEHDSLFDCDQFFDFVRKTFNLPDDYCVETYLFDYLDLPQDICEKYDIALLGGYINGVNI